MALLGRGVKGGVFEVEDYAFAGLPPQEAVEQESENEEEGKEKWVKLQRNLKSKPKVFL